MVKPQALPFAIPFAAWFLATLGWRGSLRAVGIAAAVTFLLWLPFLAANGPIKYLGYLLGYQETTYNFLSLRAWNPWWIVQLMNGGTFISDQDAIFGPLRYRWLGLAITAAIGLVVFVGVYRRPSPERLAMGIAAISLGTFVGLTTMHERYAYPAFVFLILCWPGREVVAAWALLAVACALDLFYAVPPPGMQPPAEFLVSAIGAVAITAVAVVTLRWTWSRRRLDAERGEPASISG